MSVIGGFYDKDIKIKVENVKLYFSSDTQPFAIFINDEKRVSLTQNHISEKS